MRTPYLGSMKFKQMENVSLFIQWARTIGVPDHSNLTTVAVYEQKDEHVVVGFLHVVGTFVAPVPRSGVGGDWWWPWQRSLLGGGWVYATSESQWLTSAMYRACVCPRNATGSYIQRAFPGYDGPKLGPKIAEANARTFTLAQKLASGAAVSKWSLGSSETQDRSTVSGSTLHNYDNRKGAVQRAPPTAASNTWADTRSFGGAAGIESKAATMQPAASPSAVRSHWGEISANPAAAAEACGSAMGWLSKEAQGLLKNWKRRWFVLENQQLL